MELNNFARIGKGVLSKAIGLQKNYVEEYVKEASVINEHKSNCFDCPIYKAKTSFITQDVPEVKQAINSKCQCCSSAVFEPHYKIVRRYINEKNMYGYQPTLKSCSIKLFLLYHFLQPDAYGLVRNLNLKELAKTIGCTVATIRHCNQVLEDYNYCYISNSGTLDNCINVYIADYKNYHKTASEGGRGYITLSAELFNQLLSMKTLNVLRLNIKGILEVDNSRLRDALGSSFAVQSSYKHLRGFLPRYCKNNVIRKALEQNNSIFDLSFTDASVVFSIHDNFAQKKIRSEMLEESKGLIVNFVDSINDIVENTFSDNFADSSEAKEKLMALNIADRNSYDSLLLRLDDYVSLASLSIQYNLNLVFDAIIFVYNNYVLRHLRVDNFGALVRTIIRKRYSSISSVA